MLMLKPHPCTDREKRVSDYHLSRAFHIVETRLIFLQLDLEYFGDLLTLK